MHKQIMRANTYLSDSIGNAASYQILFYEENLEEDTHTNTSSEPNEPKERKSRGRPTVDNPPKVKQPRGRPRLS